MPFCPHCGKPTKPLDRFCASCGKGLNPVTTENPTIAQESVTASTAPLDKTTSRPKESEAENPRPESIRLILPDLMLKKGMIRADAYTLIVTNHRTIFAEQTKEIETYALERYRAKIDAAEGVSGVIKFIAKIGKSRALIEWYQGKTLAEILTESAGNFALNNTEILNVKIWDDGDSELTTHYVSYTMKDRVINCNTLHDLSELKNAYRSK
jgi:hypothetical protein